MQLIVTGGTGFIGGSLVKKLLEQGHGVRVIARSVPPKDKNLEGAVYHSCDLSVRRLPPSVLSGIDLVFHVAAKAGVAGTYSSYHSANYQATLNVLESCLASGVPRLVYTSTPSVTFSGKPIRAGTESLPYAKDKVSYYSLTKAMAEKAVVEAHDPGKFQTLAHEIAEATGTEQSAEGIAEGFLTIATEKMASAIKYISVQRGYDVTEYTLVCFGGAGGQHACRVADALGMETIFIHPLAGVLSAYGMGLAEVHAHRERAVELELTVDALKVLATVFAELETQCGTELAEQGINAADVTFHRSLHLRYAGTDTVLEVPLDNLDVIVRAFENTHRARFGFIDSGRGLVIEAALAEAIGATEKAMEEPIPRRAGAGPRAGRRKLCDPLRGRAWRCRGRVCRRCLPKDRDLPHPPPGPVADGNARPGR